MKHSDGWYISREWEYPAEAPARIADILREYGSGDFKGYPMARHYIGLTLHDVTTAFRVVSR